MSFNSPAKQQRVERHLMRQRGAGARTISANFGFSVAFGAPPSNDATTVHEEPTTERRKTIRRDELLPTTERRRTILRNELESTTERRKTILRNELLPTVDIEHGSVLATKTPKPVKKRRKLALDDEHNEPGQVQLRPAEDSFVTGLGNKKKAAHETQASEDSFVVGLATKKKAGKKGKAAATVQSGVKVEEVVAEPVAEGRPKRRAAAMAAGKVTDGFAEEAAPIDKKRRNVETEKKTTVRRKKEVVERKEVVAEPVLESDRVVAAPELNESRCDAGAKAKGAKRKRDVAPKTKTPGKWKMGAVEQEEAAEPMLQSEPVFPVLEPADSRCGAGARAKGRKRKVRDEVEEEESSAEIQTVQNRTGSQRVERHPQQELEVQSPDKEPLRSPDERRTGLNKTTRNMRKKAVNECNENQNADDHVSAAKEPLEPRGNASVKPRGRKRKAQDDGVNTERSTGLEALEKDPDKLGYAANETLESRGNSKSRGKKRKAQDDGVTTKQSTALEVVKEDADGQPVEQIDSEELVAQDQHEGPLKRSRQRKVQEEQQQVLDAKGEEDQVDNRSRDQASGHDSETVAKLPRKKKAMKAEKGSPLGVDVRPTRQAPRKRRAKMADVAEQDRSSHVRRVFTNHASHESASTAANPAEKEATPHFESTHKNRISRKKTARTEQLADRRTTSHIENPSSKHTSPDKTTAKAAESVEENTTSATEQPATKHRRPLAETNTNLTLQSNSPEKQPQKDQAEKPRPALQTRTQPRVASQPQDERRPQSRKRRKLAVQRDDRDAEPLLSPTFAATAKEADVKKQSLSPRVDPIVQEVGVESVDRERQFRHLATAASKSHDRSLFEAREDAVQTVAKQIKPKSAKHEDLTSIPSKRRQAPPDAKARQLGTEDAGDCCADDTRPTAEPTGSEDVDWLFEPQAATMLQQPKPIRKEKTSTVVKVSKSRFNMPDLDLDDLLVDIASLAQGETTNCAVLPIGTKPAKKTAPKTRKRG
ncbi:hypothetical protein LTR37_014885 [Vermiconidia calcicola]|uniref:Uncharacterized protein n=1 Tax=Vermiconidia calcicola TaxID=1690605 RepID=A0ACC3MSE1_9PEZI|nr:hypothetical protein LTR37_014885 [Vermiconidia calcicola]